MDLDPAIDCEFVKFFVGKAMNGFGRKSLPKLGFATFDLFAAFLADAFGKVREKTYHCPGRAFRGDLKLSGEKRLMQLT